MCMYEWLSTKREVYITVHNWIIKEGRPSLISRLFEYTVIKHKLVHNLLLNEGDRI
jgi:hypothetical protein